MQKFFLNISCFLLAIGLFSACGTDLIPTPTSQENQLWGTWVSEGVGVADFLKDSITYVSLTLTKDSAYVMERTDTSGLITIYEGSYFWNESASLDSVFFITFNQFSPEPAVHSGIYEVRSLPNPDELSVEVIDEATTFNTSLVIPTPLEGFGSTDDFMLEYLQKYKRVVE